MDRSDSRTRRVLHVVERMDRGGVETLLMNVYRQIDRDKTQFDFAVHADRPAHYDDEIVSLGGQIFRHPKPCEAGFWKYGKALWSTLRRHGPFAAVHSHVHHFSGFVLLVAGIAGVPVRVVHSHTTQDGHPSSLSRKIYRRCMRALIERCATNKLANSHAAAEALYGGWSVGGCGSEILPNGVDLRAYENQSGDRDALRQRLGLPAHDKLIGHIGTFRPVKNHRFLLEVFARLLRRQPGVSLVLVGDGPLRPEVEQQITAMGLQGRVHLLGSRSDVPSIMEALDLLLFPSIYEGLGNVLVEAQAVGLPCLASRGVPADADLGLRLVRFLDLEADPETWVKEAVGLVGTERPAWTVRRLTLESQGYDVRSTAARLCDVYAAAR